MCVFPKILNEYWGKEKRHNKEQMTNGMLHWYEIFFWNDEQVLELDRGGGCKTL